MNDHSNDMNDHFRPTGREVVSDQAIVQDLQGVNLQNKQFERLVATKKRFTDCNFSYSKFESAYLRNCTFDSCKFIGCKFMQSNLRGSKFEGCVFDYAEFSQTQVEQEILDMGCPGQENLQQKFARTLRVNFHQIGDTVAANKAIKIELEAGRVHLHKAWRSRESYYRKKYPGVKRLGAFFEWLEFVLLDAFWGNGESSVKLLRTLVFVGLAIALGDVYFLKDPLLLDSYLSAAKNAPQVFLGIVQPNGFSGLVLAGIAAVRYVMLACLVSILVKRFSRR
ncbi:MAG: pentapeptide repeat-containing protein [Pseudomonadota bacterium]